MQKYVKNYLDYFDKTDGDFIFCEVCGNVGIDIHHIQYRSQGGSDEVSNLVCLCRRCHDWAHANGKKARAILEDIVIERH